MDTSSILTTLLSQSSIKGISQATSASTSDVTNILANAVPALLQGAQKQTSGANSASFLQALTDHAQDNTSNVTSFLKNVDLTDGSKIVSHLLTASATNSIAKASGTDANTTKSVLSAAAPLFMSLLGQQTSGSSSNAIGTLLGGLTKNLNVTSLLGGLLGGSSSGSSTASSTSSSGKKDSKTGSAAGLVSGLMGLLK